MDINNLRDETKQIVINSLLETACFRGDLEKVEKLIEMGADVHYRHSNPLKLACMAENLNVVKFLLDKEYFTRWHISSLLLDLLEKNKIQTVTFLLSPNYIKFLNINYLYEYPLRMSIEKRLFLIADILIKNGANINVFDGFLLMNAVKARDITAIKFISNYKIKDSIMNKVVKYVADICDIEIISLLSFDTS